MPAVSVMLKPASSLCNMSCEYCFYHSLANRRESFSYGLMSEMTAENIVKKTLSYADGAPVYISLQGGEPLLRGKDFFLLIANSVRAYNFKRSEVTLAVQTNGLLIDEEWCSLLLEDNWLVGLSLDGHESANSKRKDNSGNPVFERVLGAARLLAKKRVEFNILSVVTEESAKEIRNVYKFLTGEGFRHLQFIPCLGPLGEGASSFSMTSKTYGDYLVALFKLYLEDIRQGRYVSVRHLDNFVLLSQHRPAEQCGQNGVCSRQFVVEGDGSVYPCDFYCVDEYKMGNINDLDFEELAKSEVMMSFLRESAKPLPHKCRACAYLSLCRGGGCKREKANLSKCEPHRRFFAYAMPYLKNIR